jgi:hypothetical protein
MRIPQSFSEEELDVLVRMVGEAQGHAGSLKPINEMPGFAKLCGKIQRMKERARDKALAGKQPHGDTRG